MTLTCLPFRRLILVVTFLIPCFALRLSGQVLTVTKSHTGTFTVGQTGTYTISISNTGTAPTTGTITATDPLPSGLVAISAGGDGWSCAGTTTVTCTRADSLAAGAVYPPLTLTVSVGSTGSGVLNFVNVTGGGDAGVHTAFDQTLINSPMLTITNTHAPDPFTTGQTGTVTITVGNMGMAATVGTVTMTDSFLREMTLTSVNAPGWSCSSNIVLICTRSDSLAPGSHYPPIVMNLTMGTSTANTNNRASVTGGGDPQTYSADDFALVLAPVLAIAKTHTGTFTTGLPGAYTITVGNVGMVATVGTVTLNDFLPTGLAATAVSGAGWNCSAVPTTSMTCTRSDSLAAGANYPALILTVVPDSTAQGNLTNSADVEGGDALTSVGAVDPTTINLPSLAITMSHTGDFSVGRPGDYTITVSNVGTVTTGAGTLAVNDVLPRGLTAVAAAGTGWNCQLTGLPPIRMNCTRPAGGFAPGASLPPITLTVNAGVDAPSLVTNSVSFTGVVDTNPTNDSASDLTTITGDRFVPVTPCRIADTRNANGAFGGPFLSANSTRGFAIPAGGCGIPATAQAYSLNFTVVPHAQLGFLTVFPCGATPPLASLLNSQDGRVKAGAAIVPAGTGGSVCAFPSNDTDLVIDINGYFLPAADPSGLAFYPMTPCRLIDTRLAAGPLGGPALGASATRTFPISLSPCAVPAAAQSYSLNYTVVPAGPLGFLTTWPAGGNQPLVSTLNAPGGAVTANAAIVPAGTNGDISVFVTNATDLVVDIDGYFAPPGPGGLSLYTATPCRVRDTRNPVGSPPLNGQLDITMSLSPCTIRNSAQAYVVNATVVPPAGLGFLTLWPQGLPQPLVSTLNATDGTITSNMAIVPTMNGAISVFAPNPTHLVLDVTGFFAP